MKFGQNKKRRDFFYFIIIGPATRPNITKEGGGMKTFYIIKTPFSSSTYPAPPFSNPRSESFFFSPMAAAPFFSTLSQSRHHWSISIQNPNDEKNPFLRRHHHPKKSHILAA